MADGPRLTGLGKLFILLFIGVCVTGAYYFFTNKTPWSSPGKGGTPPGGMFDGLGGGDQVEIGIAQAGRGEFLEDHEVAARMENLIARKQRRD